ncbi:hypothetical protein C8F04DRAFT_1173905 [Mycena alexandri]|uniref:Major facilitator superfamily (MFS) profile domain-containing protein n=1 Tax=Mycena alexandri TaxID=1745969 RepID=A0AAD6XB73_9AGAR|nr:hypothetical protein C8F04DRAFT_1173905 [Mycena alexandri]
MYFHNAATHCYPRDTSCAKEICWKPLHLISLAPRVPANKRDQYFELYPGSKALPRAQRSRTGTTHFQLPSGGGNEATYVLSWPAPISGLGVSTVPSSASSSARVHYTTSSATSPTTNTLSTPRTDHSALGSPPKWGDVADAPMLTMRAHSGKPVSSHRRGELRPKGWARLRPNAPPPLQIKHDKIATQSSCILESSDEDEGLVMLIWAKPTALRAEEFFLALNGVFILASTTARSSNGLLGFNGAYTFTSNIMYGVVYGFSPELFPTKDRGTGNALVATANRILGIMAPIIALYTGIATTAPIYIAGGLFIVAGFITMLLPFESQGRAAL